MSLEHQPPQPRGSRVHTCAVKEHLLGICCVPGLALGLGVVSNPTSCGITWRLSGRAWGKSHVPGPFPVLPANPGPKTYRVPIPSPVPWSLLPSYLKDTAPCNLLPLHHCVPSEQNALCFF